MFQIYSQIKRIIGNICVVTNYIYQILIFSLLLYLVKVPYTSPKFHHLPSVRGTHCSKFVVY